MLVVCFFKVDIFINNFGIFDFKLFEEIDDVEW